jgi:hypothetical protein
VFAQAVIATRLGSRPAARVHAEMSLLKADLGIAALCSGLVPDRGRVGTILREEDRAVAHSGTAIRP